MKRDQAKRTSNDVFGIMVTMAEPVDPDPGNMINACGEDVERVGELQQQGIRSADLREGRAAWAERRPPRFRGK